MLSVTLLALTPTAQAQGFVIDLPDLGIKPPVIDAPAEGEAYLWDNLIIDPSGPTFEFRHGMPTTQDTSPVQADTIALCAWVHPSGNCETAGDGLFAPNEVFAVFDADNPALNRYALGGPFTPIHVGYGFDFTPNLHVPNFQFHTVTYKLGACEGTPTGNWSNWAEDNCAFSEERTFVFTTTVDDWGWGW